MKTGALLFLSALALGVGLPAPLSIANAGRPRSTSPVCPLKCPDGFQDALYTWELHPERTIYDEQGKTIVPPDGVWVVSCALKCQHHEVNQPTKSFSDKAEVCRSGGEPAPYRGPWRIVGQFSRECAARHNNECGMQCYEIRKAPVKKASRKRR